MTQGDIVRIIEKSRLENDGHHNHVHRETWTEVEVVTDEPISQEMADELWHEFGVDPEEENIEVESE